MSEIINEITNPTSPVSISDIKDSYFEGVQLSQEEKIALVNYDRYRIEYLNDSSNDQEFESRYFELQVIANLKSFEYFINPKNLEI